MNVETLSGLALKYGTPLYVYDGSVVRLQYQRFRSFFSYPKVAVHYAMKANFNPEILRILCDEGCGIDAVSLAEVLLAKRIGFDTSAIMYTANMISDEEMNAVQAEGVLFNIDSLSRLEKYGKAHSGSAVCLRINPGVKTGHHENVMTGGDETKFGINAGDFSCALDICAKYRLRVIGVHEHAGSGIPEAVDMMNGFGVVLGVLRQYQSRLVDLKFVDFGGGFKVAYVPSEKVPDYQMFGSEVSQLFSDFCSESGFDLELRFEPGRFLVAEAGYLLVQVNTMKKNGERVIVGVNSGFSQLVRPMMYGAYHHITHLNDVGLGMEILGNDEMKSDEVKVYDVVGNICESGDYFAKARKMGVISEGDILVIHTTGAYGYSMGSVYNLRSNPSEVVVDFVGGVQKITFFPALGAKGLVDSLFERELV